MINSVYRKLIRRINMYRILTTLSMLIIITSLLGCGLFTSVVGKEEWSKNYSLADGVTATAPEMIDGNLKTSGKTASPAGTDQSRGTPAVSEAIVTLPERKSIYKVIIYSSNLRTFDLMADKGDNNWERIKEVKSVQGSPIELRVSTLTNKIKVRVKSTTDDAKVGREQRSRAGGGRRGRRRAPGDISEIEIYGYASSEQAASTSEEAELDKLLSK